MVVAADDRRAAPTAGPAAARAGTAAWAAASLAPPDVAGPHAGEDLAEPLEAGDRAGRQEVVDVREGGAHPGGERLVAGRAGERVEPDEAVAVAAEAGGLGRDERRIAAVPAVGDDDDDAATCAASAAPSAG